MSIEDIRARLAACPIPKDAQADWQGTNHYEITTSSRQDCGYLWLDNLNDEFALDSATETGKRLGTCLDYAVAYKRDVSELLKEIERLEHR